MPEAVAGIYLLEPFWGVGWGVWVYVWRLETLNVFLNLFFTYFLRHDLSMNREFTDMARLAGQ